MHPDPQILADIPLFGGLSPDQLEAVAQWCEIRSVDAGTQLIGEGAAGYTFFLLQEGAVRVTRGSEEIATLSPGECFGEMAILGGGRRNATVETTEPSVVLAIFGSDFRQLEAAMPETATRIKDGMAARLAQDV